MAQNWMGKGQIAGGEHTLKCLVVLVVLLLSGY